MVGAFGLSKASKRIECSDCGEPLTEEIRKCPKCGSTRRHIFVTVTETISVTESLGLRKKSGQKDDRGKPITEERIRVKGGTQTRMTIDRSKRLKGLPITDVTHEVIKNGKTIHGPHLEPKSKKNKEEMNIRCQT